MKSIKFLHPFSAEAIGLSEEELFHLHSKPHIHALMVLSEEGNNYTLDYFTQKMIFKKLSRGKIIQQFWPVSLFSLLRRNKWRHQYSNRHYRSIKRNPPDLTIINMSGLGSKYVFDLGKLLLSKGKKYIAMIGGMEVSFEGNAIEYFKHANHIIVHTLVQKKALLAKSEFQNLEIHVMPLGIDTKVFAPKKLDSKQLTGDLLFVGRLSRIKNIECAIDAVHYLLNNGFLKANLRVIGPVSDLLYFNELKELVVSKGLSQNVTFEGSKPYSELVEIYQNSELLLLPSYSESFGMVMTEAMSCGMPVIAIKNSGGADEIIEDGIDGVLTDKLNYNSKILEVLSNEQYYLNLRANAIRKVEKEFSLQKTIEALKFSINKAL